LPGAFICFSASLAFPFLAVLKDPFNVGKGAQPDIRSGPEPYLQGFGFERRGRRSPGTGEETALSGYGRSR